MNLATLNPKVEKSVVSNLYCTRSSTFKNLLTNLDPWSRRSDTPSCDFFFNFSFLRKPPVPPGTVRVLYVGLQEVFDIHSFILKDTLVGASSLFIYKIRRLKILHTVRNTKDERDKLPTVVQRNFFIDDGRNNRSNT